MRLFPMIIVSLVLSSEDHFPWPDLRLRHNPLAMIRISSSVHTLLPSRAREPQSNSVNFSHGVVSSCACSILGAARGTRGEKHQAPSAVMWATVSVLDS